MRQSDRVERMKRVSTRRRYVSLAASAVFRFNDSTLQRLRSNGQAFNPWHAIVRRLPDDGGTGESLHMPGQRAGYSRSLFRHGLGRGCGVGRGLGNGVDLGVAMGVGLGVTVEVGVGVTVGLAVGVALGVGVGLGKHALTTSTKRATTCWFPWSVWTPVTRKPPSFLLATTEPRAKSCDVPSNTFTASPSGTPSEDRSCTKTLLEFGSSHLTR